ncbi:MAG: hypothetical protein JSV36_05250 [Anaerolineae bacterium]|nr:MAG: hypothetical protein JSV36_05250 [Anaerolineae bacterium]
MLGEWVSRCELSSSVAWISLDEGNNDSARFWSHVVAALQTVQEDVGEIAQSAFGETVESLSPVVQPLIEPLSERELEVLRLIVAGLSNPEIARDLVIAVSTVKSHVNHIFGKLGVKSRTQTVARARELDLL